ncbi:hypothetical protein FIC_01130 [Flavobacteriaceae bacterium 3519-10]|nr:hypothetical protein FIC_01130 [Flavobacteriaceae bacterium 3519-10]
MPWLAGFIGKTYIIKEQRKKTDRSPLSLKSHFLDPYCI